MLLPKILAGPEPTSRRKKAVDAVSLFSSTTGLAQELAILDSGNTIQCFVPLSLGDKLSVQFGIPSGEFDIVDIVVDGIVRETSFNTRMSKIHKGTFLKLCHCERRETGTMGKIKHCEMLVVDRSKTHDAGTGVGNFSKTNLAAVGTIEIRVYRRKPADMDEAQGALLVQAERGPTFEKYAAWWEVSKQVDINGGDPPYQIDFTDAKPTFGASRKHINQEISDFYVWASFKYLYRSIPSIKAMGFAVVEDPSEVATRSRNDRAPHSESMTESPSIASHGDSNGEASCFEEGSKLPHVIGVEEGRPPLPLAPKSLLAMPLTGPEPLNSPKLAESRSGIKAITLSPCKKKVFGDDFPTPVDGNYPIKSEEEGDIFARGTTGNGESNNQSGVRGVSLPRLAAPYARLDAERAYVVKELEKDSEKKAVSSSQMKGDGEYDEASRCLVERSYSSESLPREVESQSVDVNSLRGFEQNLKKENNTLGPLNSVKNGFRDEDGHNSKRNSPAAEASDCASGSNAKSSVAVQTQPYGSLLPQKRKYEDFSTGGITDNPPSIKREVSTMSNAERSFLNNYRREEHARKKQLKKLALDRANAEAEAFRRQLEEIEAKIAADFAKEDAEDEAELKDLDREIDLAKQKSQALKARIQELEICKE